MGLDKIALSILLFSVITIFSVLMITDISINYDDVDISTDKFTNINNKSLAITNTLNTTSQGIKEKTFGQVGEGTPDETAVEESLFKGAFGAIKLVPDLFSLMGEIINAIAEEIEVPKIFVVGAVAAITLFIAFAGLFLILRITHRP